MKNKKILITGGLGFIGSNLVERCLKLGANVTIYDNLDTNSGGNLFNIESFKDNINLVIGDICNFEHLIQVVLNQDIIINCAASTSHPYSMKEPWANLDVNSRGVVNILEAIRRVNRDVRLIHLGTTTQLGKLQYQPADELHPEFPTDMYSANKVVAEKYIMLYSRAYDLNATVIRLPNVYGPRAAIHNHEFTFNNYFVGLALQNKSITVYKPGGQMRNALYVEDAVKAVLIAAESCELASETFFVVSDDHYSVKEIAEQTCIILGGDVVMIDWPSSRKAIEIGDAIISNQKFKKATGWYPAYSFEKGLMLTRDYYSTCLDHYLNC